MRSKGSQQRRPGNCSGWWVPTVSIPPHREPLHAKPLPLVAEVHAPPTPLRAEPTISRKQLNRYYNQGILALRRIGLRSKNMSGKPKDYAASPKAVGSVIILFC